MRYPAKLWQYQDCQGGRANRLGDNRHPGKKHITKAYPGGTCQRLQMLPSKAMPHGQERVKDISCWLPSVPYQCKVTFIQFLFIWERRPQKKGILEQTEYFLVDTNLSAALSGTHKSPCGYNKFWTTELMTTRSLSFLARGTAAILNFLKLHCLMIFYNAELLQPQS